MQIELGGTKQWEFRGYSLGCRIRGVTDRLGSERSAGEIDVEPRGQ